MRRSRILRSIFILALIVLALVYLYPTFESSQMNKELDQRLEAISQSTNIPMAELRERIFQFDIDLSHSIRSNETIPADVKDQAIEEIELLRGEFFETLDEADSKAINLGLDLQGGMHLVLEVNLVELMDNLAKNRDATYEEISVKIHEELTANPQFDFERVVLAAFEEKDIRMARYFGDPRQSDREILRELRTNAEEAVELTLTKLRNRIDEFGVSEPSITPQGSRRIVVELPGVQDPTRARNLIGRTALLEFQLVAKPEVTATLVRDIDNFLADKLEEEGAFEGTTEPSITAAEGGDEVSGTQALLGGDEADTTETLASQFDQDRPFVSLLNLFERQITVFDSDRIRLERYLSRQDVQALIPPEYEFLWSNKLRTGRDGRDFWTLYLVKERPELTGSALSDASVTIGTGASDPTQAGAAIVNLTMKREGARRFARITENNIGEPLAIVLDGKIHMAPSIRSRIPDGRAIIEGSESVDEANDLAIVLRAGALPAPVDIIEERTVGPSLGADSIKAGTMSAVLGLVLVMIFMIFYYRGSGLVAVLALVLNIIFLMAVLGGFGFTLTLPGIAGIILTIGMAVDANVLIFERIREEIRAGKTVWNAIKNGYDRALITILDANVTTAIAGLVLYQFGTGPIRGFALTLIIGIIASMFTALVVSRAIFDWITDTWSVKKLSI